MEYAFLADFDLLRDPAKLGEVRPWATPASRLILDKYFKIERAREEIKRCDIEIRRVITSIRDEAAFLLAKEDQLWDRQPALAWAVRRYRYQRQRYDDTHLKRFEKLAKKAGHRFTGTLEPGVHPGASEGLAEARETNPMEGLQSRNEGEDEAVARSLALQMEASTDKDEEKDIDDDEGNRVEE